MTSLEQSTAELSPQRQWRYLFPDRQTLQELASLLDCAKQALKQDAQMASLYIANAAALLRSDTENSQRNTSDLTPGRHTCAVAAAAPRRSRSPCSARFSRSGVNDIDAHVRRESIP